MSFFEFISSYQYIRPSRVDGFIPLYTGIPSPVLQAKPRKSSGFYLFHPANLAADKADLDAMRMD